MSPFGRIESVSARAYAGIHSDEKPAHQTYALHKHQLFSIKSAAGALSLSGRGASGAVPATPRAFPPVIDAADASSAIQDLTAA
jgi:hypothetical protein